ncbi:DoxX family protein [Micromonospora sp. CA-240977]|uniref:DoxX family protein n=1 Tax=Micromonospora sp. CA-240977 TaxID=3239957 RepID=UPI003D8BEF1B
MNVVLWIAAILLAVVFLASGIMKLLRSKEQLAGSGQTWVESFPDSLIKIIGALEIAAAAGLILPPAFDIAPVLAPVAAVGLIVLMVGAVVTHARRKEYTNVIVNIVLILLAAFVAWGRFGSYSF